MLMHHTNAMIDRILTGVKMHFFSAQKNLAGGDTLHSIKHLHQCTFTGSILAYPRMNLSFFHAEVHFMVGQHTALINLCQIPYFQNWFHKHCSLSSIRS